MKPKYWLLLFCFILINACGNNTGKEKLKEYVIHPEDMHNTLYFSGTIQPLDEQTLTTPMAGVIEKMNLQYGARVKKDEIIFILNSPELQKQYNDTLTEYLKAKDNYLIAKNKFAGTNDLWEAGLISKNSFLSEKSSLNANHLTLVQTGQKLAEMLEKMGSQSYHNLAKLSFEKFDKVRDALAGQHDLIYIRSPVNGVLLYPPQTQEEKKRIRVGSSIKAGDPVAVVGNLSGIRIEIEVPEVDIDKIKKGLPATVRGNAFAKKILHGKLVNINAQANTGQNTLPSFTAIVEIHNLTPEEQNLIKVGMSAKIELAIDSLHKILIPIPAVLQKNGNSFVRVKDKKGKILEHEVITGAAQADKVIIESGLADNDTIVYE